MWHNWCLRGAPQQERPMETQSSSTKERVLIIDDDQSQCDLFAMALERHGYAVTTTTSPKEALELAAQQSFDTVVTDLGMTELDGLLLCERMLGTSPEVPIIVVTGLGSMDAAISAMRAGAYDFLTKPVDAKVLSLSVARAAQHRRLKSEVKRLREAAQEPSPKGLLVGDSAAMKRVADLVV